MIQTATEAEDGDTASEGDVGGSQEVALLPHVHCIPVTIELIICIYFVDFNM